MWICLKCGEKHDGEGPHCPTPWIHASHTKPVTGCPECIRAAERVIDAIIDDPLHLLKDLYSAVFEWRKVRGEE